MFTPVEINGRYFRMYMSVYTGVLMVAVIRAMSYFIKITNPFSEILESVI